MSRDLYEILGVDKKATKEEIKRAHRKRARETHPDHNEGKDDNMFKEVQLAYEVLSNDARRSKYDSNGSTDNRSQESVFQTAETMKKRVIYKGKERNLFAEALDNHLADFEKQINTLTDFIAQRKEFVKFLGDFDYEVEREDKHPR